MGVGVGVAVSPLMGPAAIVAGAGAGAYAGSLVGALGKMEEKPAAATPEKSEPAKPAAQELPPPGAHLIIESKDGTKIDRPMSTVRRVVVEGGTIIIVLKTGKIERIPMSTVARMAIEP